MTVQLPVLDVAETQCIASTISALSLEESMSYVVICQVSFLVLTFVRFSYKCIRYIWTYSPTKIKFKQDLAKRTQTMSRKVLYSSSSSTRISSAHVESMAAIMDGKFWYSAMYCTFIPIYYAYCILSTGNTLSTFRWYSESYLRP